MAKRWFLYLAAVLGCLVFYLAYQQWVSWILLMGVLFLPLVSLAFSLPAMVSSRVCRETPAAIQVRSSLQLQVFIRSKLPTPPWKVAVQAYHTLTGENLLLSAQSFYPTAHCGALNCRVRRSRVYDYLGMFYLPLKKPANFRIFIRPKPIAPAAEPDLTQLLVNAWRPKIGGGFAENHELRLYRPGDSLQQIHWKLTAKTGKLILREPMVADKNRMLLWLILQGDPDQLDRKLGRLLWMSRFLLQHGLEHDILAYTGQGERVWHVADRKSLQRAMDSLLCYSPYTETEKPVLTQHVNWQYYIGGEEDAEKA